jgi:hypothetical protein
VQKSAVDNHIGDIVSHDDTGENDGKKGDFIPFGNNQGKGIESVTVLATVQGCKSTLDASPAELKVVRGCFSALDVRKN